MLRWIAAIGIRIPIRQSDEAEFVFEPKAKAKTDIASPGRLPVKFDALPFMDEPAGGVAFEV